MFSSLDFSGIAAFHCGIFATFYFCAAAAIWIYYSHIRGDIALCLESIASGLVHVFAYLIMVIDPTNKHLVLALVCFCCAASPTILLCIREAIEPGWISWKRYFQYIGGFLGGTVLAFFFAREYIFYILIAADFWFCCFASYHLTKGINRHERRIKEYFSEIESYSYNWVKYFVYFQVANVVIFFHLYQFQSTVCDIIFNYIQAGYWLYFLLMCKEYRYYSRQIPEELREDISKSSFIADDQENDDEAEENDEKELLSPDVVVFIENRLSEIEEKKSFLESSFNLAMLAQDVGTNRTYMSLYFRSKNMTFWDYVNRKRCEYAIELMKENSSLTMASISHRSGYKTENCFRSSFLTIYGKTPFVFKRELRGSTKQ